MTRLRLAIVAAAVATLAFAGVASAYWTSTATTGSHGAAAAGSLPTVTGVAGGSPTGSSVPVSWDAVGVPSGVTVHYLVQRYAGATATVACSSSTGALTATNCTDTSVPPGTFRYTVTAEFASWVGPESAQSAPVITDLQAPTAAFTFPTSAGIYNDSGWNGGCTSAICGTAHDDAAVASVEVAIQRGSGSYWNGVAFASAGRQWLPAIGTTGWSLAFAASAFGQDGAYTVSVRATDSSGNVTAPVVERSFTITNAPPVVSPTFPVAGTSYNTASWTAGCAAGAGVCGTASSGGPAPLADVAVSLRRVSDGLYYTGSAFTSGAVVFLDAGTTATWRLPFAAASFPTDGDYTVVARATDTAGNTATSLSRTFTVDRVGPLAPAITGKPADPTSSTTAQFTFTGEGGAAFSCRLDSGAIDTGCPAAKSYAGVAPGSHTFKVWQVDAAGNVGAQASYTWLVDTVAPTTTAALSPSPNGAGWNRANVGVTLTATDAGGAGVSQTTYSTAGAQTTGTTTVSGSSASLTITAEGTTTITFHAVDTAGNIETDKVSVVKVDKTAPSAGSISYAAGYRTSAAIALTLAEGSDATSGIVAVTVQRDVATLAANVCGAFPGTYATSLNVATGATSFTDSTVTGGRCYQYRLLVDDAASNQTTTSPLVATVVKVDTTAPSVPTVTIDTLTGATATGAGASVFYRPAGSGSFRVNASGSTDAESGFFNYLFPSLGSGWTTAATPTTTTYTYTGTPSVPSSLAVTASNNAGSTSTTPFTVTPDSAAVTGTIAAPAGSTYNNGYYKGSVTVTSADISDGSGSGIASVTFQRSPATAGTWTTIGTANATPWQTILNTTGLSDGGYDLRFTSTDRVGNAGTSTGTASINVLNTAITPTAVALTDNAGGAGVAAAGDTLALTYSQAPHLASICSAWTTDGVNASLTNITATIGRNAYGNGRDGLSMSSASCSLNVFSAGDLNLLSDYTGANSDVVFTSSTLSWNAATKMLTLTLGTRTGTPGTALAATVTYSPSTTITGLSGVGIAGTASAANQRF